MHLKDAIRTHDHYRIGLHSWEESCFTKFPKLPDVCTSNKLKTLLKSFMLLIVLLYTLILVYSYSLLYKYTALTVQVTVIRTAKKKPQERNNKNALITKPRTSWLSKQAHLQVPFSLGIESKIYHHTHWSNSDTGMPWYSVEFCSRLSCGYLKPWILGHLFKDGNILWFCWKKVKKGIC